jgi:hypothetical protein
MQQAGGRAGLHHDGARPVDYRPRCGADDDRYGYWVYVVDVDATLGPVLISCRHGHTLATASTAAALAGLRAAGAPVVYLGAPV